MLTRCFTIYTLFLISIISARPSPSIIYSAIIYNRQSSSIQCNITWLKPSADKLQSGLFTIEKNTGRLVKEKTFDMDGWQARAIIEKIQCGNLVLAAPFRGVDGPSINWGFVVENNEIVSVRPKSRTSQR